MFYTAFESEFQAYLWQTYGARISVMETNANLSGKPANAVPVNAAGKHIRYILQSVVAVVTFQRANNKRYVRCMQARKSTTLHHFYYYNT